MTHHPASELAQFEMMVEHNPSLKWYAVADAAQHKLLPGVVVHAGCKVGCLFGASQGSQISRYTPHLVEMKSPSKDSIEWKWILRNAQSHPCVLVIATEVNFETLFCHLIRCTEVALPCGELMFFAFWDPAILGALVGQSDDLSLHVKGPILSVEQRGALMRHMAQLWYWGRNGDIHVIKGEKLDTFRTALPLRLDQRQVDELVEASVPDHILYYLELNQPLLVDKIPPADRYELVSRSLQRAREIGLIGVGDMLNFVCLEIIYKERMQQDSQILDILDRIKNGIVDFREAIKEFP
ncbi:hypothetical protein SRABI118_03902 [Massilia sp. Bi118]|uniref:DUF4123 domain-containing protein n=1 Tax=Massilia sp. Bi118 TaxID=2822346 RepID=UPI001D33FBB0|nr:DUF4123 domain-containing protein [Massilia sp. Bi118]CAH0285110.1 hypothetical protein SRABI118_03902 [Massilia sp. Bi118]